MNTNGEPQSIPIYDSDTFGAHIQAYSLIGVLQKLGIPSKIMLQTSSKYWLSVEGNEPQSLFSLTVFYPDDGVLVKYTTTMKVEGTNVIGCFNNAHVTLELYPQKSRSIDSFIEGLHQQQ